MKKNKALRVSIFFGVFLCLLYFVSGKLSPLNECEQQSPGYFDLACNDGLLDGKWFFVGGTLIPPGLIDDYNKQPKFLFVPSYWDLDTLGLDGYSGYVTLWAELDLAEVTASSAPDGVSGMVFQTGDIQSSSRVYVDNGRGEVIKVFDNLSEFSPESDEPNDIKPSRWVSGLLPISAPVKLPSLYAGSRVVVQIYNEDYRIGGFSHSVVIGPGAEVHFSALARWIFHAVIIGACFVMVIYCVILAFCSVDDSALYTFLLLMSLGAGVRLMISSGLLQQLFANIRVDDFFYLSWSSALVMASVLSFSQLYILPEIFSPGSWKRKSALLLSPIPLVCILFSLVLPVNQFVMLGHWVRLVYSAICVSYCMALIVTLCFAKPKFVFPKIGVVFIISGSMLDGYLYSKNLRPYVDFFSFSIFVFILVQTTKMAWAYIQVLLKERVLFQDLKVLNDSLGHQVLDRTKDLQLANIELEKIAATDALTGVPNRRAFDLKVGAEVAGSNLLGTPVCLAICDIDWFKSVNDNYGHDFGDQVLIALAQSVETRVRRVDFFARIGGEEFALVLSNTDISTAQPLLNDIRLKLAAILFSEHPEYKLSVSFGCAEINSSDNVRTLYKRADKALYLAKQQGRGRCAVDEGDRR